MRLSKMKFILVIVILSAFTLTFTSAVYSDSQNGWKGYGLFNINNSKITILSEDVSINLQSDKLQFSGEYVIRNTTNNEIKVSLGMPSNGIERISMMENGYYIKWKKRSIESLQNEFKIENQLPQENFWYVFNLELNPAETRLISVKLDAIQQSDAEGIYTAGYFSDRKQGFSNKVEKSSLYLKVNGFEPYNIISVKGLEPYELGRKGEIYIETDEKSLEAIEIKHKATVTQALDKLMGSPMHKTREIALAFLDKNYDRASNLCDEYIKNPNDEQVSTEQVSFIKAESLRRLQKYERYLELVETMDYSKLYPAELKNKIYMDRLDVYRIQQNQEKIDNLSKLMDQQTDDSSVFLTAWLRGSGFFELLEQDKAQIIKDRENDNQPANKTLAMLEKWYFDVITIPYTPAVIFLAGILTGLLIRRGTSRKKKRKSMYIYRM